VPAGRQEMSEEVLRPPGRSDGMSEEILRPSGRSDAMSEVCQNFLILTILPKMLGHRSRVRGQKLGKNIKICYPDRVLF